jgi:hypothetical protein
MKKSAVEKKIDWISAVIWLHLQWQRIPIHKSADEQVMLLSLRFSTVNEATTCKKTAVKSPCARLANAEQVSRAAQLKRLRV